MRKPCFIHQVKIIARWLHEMKNKHKKEHGFSNYIQKNLIWFFATVGTIFCILSGTYTDHLIQLLC